ncbi:MAG: hypothetical protein HOA85_01720 [Candidatus Pacebacteria bacterium]|jgi:predicted kinase|nr:hypothetical protein [Candidatus Paceibacterota bacterium]MBT4651949.1 hypothetical protein [Candidatus Paceibacterota bacterium]MBT6755971.1 hypothetical protein [Candidatus Paceibacterota bacterium]
MITEKALNYVHNNGLINTFENIPEKGEEFQLELLEVAVFLLLIPRTKKESISELISGNFYDEAWSELSEIIKDSISETEDKLATIGLTMSQYLILYQASYQEDGLSIIEEIIDESEDLIERDEVIPTLLEVDREELINKHERIVEKILEKVSVSENQKVNIIAGPFAAGKTEVVRTRLDDEDRLEIDLDEIREMLLEDYDAEDQKDIQKVREESWMLSDLLFKTALETGRSVLIQTALHRKERWMNDKNINLAEELAIPIEIYMILRPFSDCLVRNMCREGRSVAIKDQYESMDGMSVLVDFIKRFQNIKKVVFLDFFPLLERETGRTCKISQKKYEALMNYAKHDALIEMEVREQKFDIEIINQ